MENRIRILMVLETIHRAKSQIEYKRLDILINTELFNKENDYPLWGYELLNLLKEMKKEELINQNMEQKYSITPKGLEYLKQHLDE